jgi:hypothetical protein
VLRSFAMITPIQRYHGVLGLEEKEIRMANLRLCGNKDCAVSTTVLDCLSFGSGELDSNGFWEVPCAKCARAHEIFDKVQTGSYWPHTKEFLVKMGFK